MNKSKILDDAAYELYLTSYFWKISDPLRKSTFQSIYYDRVNFGTACKEEINEIYYNANIMLRKQKLIKINKS